MRFLIEKTFDVPKDQFKVKELTDVLCQIFGTKCIANGFHRPGNYVDTDEPVDKSTIIHPITVENAGIVARVTETTTQVKLRVFEDLYKTLLEKEIQKINDYFSSIGGKPVD